MKPPSSRMPALFIGHGNPMNAIEDNSFTRALGLLGRKVDDQFGLPKAILCISAHWLSAGTFVTAQSDPKTIHDFYGFPQALFDIRYPAPGDPALAKDLSQTVTDPSVRLDSSWGLDHGTWSILKHLYPLAHIPVLQLSIDMSEPPSFHFELGQKLEFLRSRGVLIVGSGNIVHNLRRFSPQTDAKPEAWALEFDGQVKTCLENRNYEPLLQALLETEAGKLSVPTLDHYLPLLYVLGASKRQENLSFEFDGIQNGSISMRSLSFGLK